MRCLLRQSFAARWNNLIYCQLLKAQLRELRKNSLHSSQETWSQVWCKVMSSVHFRKCEQESQRRLIYYHWSEDLWHGEFVWYNPLIAWVLCTDTFTGLSILCHVWPHSKTRISSNVCSKNISTCRRISRSWGKKWFFCRKALYPLLKLYPNLSLIQCWYPVQTRNLPCVIFLVWKRGKKKWAELCDKRMANKAERVRTKQA